MLFTKLVCSVRSIEGKFLNLFLEEDFVCFYRPEGNILCCESNFGRNVADGYEPKRQIRKNNKPANNKRRFVRKKQGDGTQMNSMIQFHVRSRLDKTKIYKIKCFRQQTFGVPGVLEDDYSDVMPALEDLRDYHRKNNLNDSIEIYDIFPTLVNYKCRISNENLIIQLDNIVKELELFKKDSTEQKIIFQILNDSSKLTTNMIKTIKRYIPINRFDIAEIKYEQERVSSGITIKLCRPSIRIRKPKNLKAKTTIKIFQSGKINLDAVKSISEAEDLYTWLGDFIQARFEKIIFDVSQSDSESDSESESESDIELDSDVDVNCNYNRFQPLISQGNYNRL